MKGETKLPFTKGTNYFCLFFLGIPAALLIVLHFTEQEPYSIIRAIPALLAFPFLVFWAVPLFSFKHPYKVPSRMALLQLPFAERYAWAGLYCASIAAYSLYFQYIKGVGIAGDMVLLSGAGLLWIVLLLVVTNHSRIRFADSPDEERVTQQLTDRKANPGAFVYTEDGFTYAEEGKVLAPIKWKDITEVLAYKKDKLGVDSIYLAIKDGDECLLDISDGMFGYLMFVDRMQANLPNYATFWQIQVATPAFQPKPTLVYRKEEDLSGFPFE